MTAAAVTGLVPFLDATALVLGLGIDRSGSVTYANPAAAAYFSEPPDAITGRRLTDLVIPADRGLVESVVRGERATAAISFLNANAIHIPLSVSALVDEDGCMLLGEPSVLPFLRIGDDLAAHANDLAVQTRERGRQVKRLAAEIAEQRRTHWQLRRDQEVLPICMGCGRVHTVERGWETLAEFVRRSSDFLSHSYCEVCAEELLR